MSLPAAAGSHRPPKDRDCLISTEGLVFTVFGYRHTGGRYTAYLQYLPGEGKLRKPMDFPHVGAVDGTIGYLKKHHPRYVWRDPEIGVELSAVPGEAVRRYLEPEAALRRILAAPADALEEEIRAFATVLSESTGVALDRFGVTGSVLVGRHRPAESDMDLVLYGAEAFQRVKEAIARAIPGVTGMTGERRQRWLRLMQEKYPHDAAAARYFVGRRWNYGFYRGREFGLKAVRSDDETQGLAELPGGRPTAYLRLRAQVTGANESVFLPARYDLTDLRLIEARPAPGAEAADRARAGNPAPHPELPDPLICLAYEGLYVGAFEAGQEIEVFGKMEVTAAGPRLVVGSRELAGREYMRPLSRPVAGR